MLFNTIGKLCFENFNTTKTHFNSFKVKKATERQPTKSVARMDQVCSNIVKYHKLDEKNQAAGDK